MRLTGEFLTELHKFCGDISHILNLWERPEAGFRVPLYACRELFIDTTFDSQDTIKQQPDCLYFSPDKATPS